MSFLVFFSVQKLESYLNVKHVLFFQVIASVTRNQECVADIAASEILVYLLLLINSLPACRITVIETLYALTSNTRVIKEAMQKGEFKPRNARLHAKEH